MSRPLTDFVLSMTNEELNGLAKNRFIAADLQMAIAETGYKVAREWLASNEGLDETVRDYLWDQHPRGYMLKARMIQAGQYIDEPEKYVELYKSYPQIWSKSYYAGISTFIGGYSWYGSGAKYCPTEVLHMAYNEHFDPKKVVCEAWNEYAKKRSLLKFATHPNCDLVLAIKLSTCGIKQVETEAFKKIVELS